MALNWHWKEDHIGKVYHKSLDTGKEWVNDLYTGNALMIEIWQDDKQYCLHSFFCDEEHAKNCLGLNKGHENIFNEGWEEIRYELWEHPDKWQMHKVDKLVKLLTKARMNVHFIPLKDRVEGGEKNETQG